VNNSLFVMHVVTPSRMFEREIRYVRLRDETGFFGIMKGHIDFLTVLLPSLGYYIDANSREVFLAVDGGIFTIRDGKATLTAREVFESDNAEDLAEIIDGALTKRKKSEESFAGMLEGIERSFMEKTIELVRGRT
jgi:F-type H+-transporting ATPase subunit epsilon